MTLAALRRATGVLREAWRLPRVPADRRIFSAMVDAAPSLSARRGLSAYLAARRPIGTIVADGDWRDDAASAELRLPYTNSLFAPGCLRVRRLAEAKATLVFLPGYQAGADAVLGPGGHHQQMTEVARSLGMSLACWDWPLQGPRREGALYRNLGSVYSAEREYARVLPALGASLWREFVSELAFALARIRDLVGSNVPLHVVGWSMGGCFAYVAPFLGVPVSSTTAAGSCARLTDLLAAGATRVHGYFFYPLDGVAYFDLDDLVAESLARDHPLRILHGDRDHGCLAETRKALARRAAACGRGCRIDVMPGHGHVFSPAMKAEIARWLAER